MNHSVQPITNDKTAAPRAAEIRRLGRAVLNGGEAQGNRMLLILGLLITMTVAGCLVLLAASVYSVCVLIGGETLWADIVAYVVLGVTGVAIALPLGVAVYRMACRMAAGLPVRLEELFYPFTRPAAYGRAMVVGLETLLWLLAVVGLPILCHKLCGMGIDFAVSRGLYTWLASILRVVVILPCLLPGVGVFLLSGWRAGFGYYVFTEESLSLGDVYRYFGGFRHRLWAPFVWRLSLTGWMVISFVAILVPYLVHTIPYALCCNAAYARGLERK